MTSEQIVIALIGKQSSGVSKAAKHLVSLIENAGISADIIMRNNTMREQDAERLLQTSSASVLLFDKIRSPSDIVRVRQFSNRVFFLYLVASTTRRYANFKAKNNQPFGLHDFLQTALSPREEAIKYLATAANSTEICSELSLGSLYSDLERFYYRDFQPRLSTLAAFK